MKNTFFSLVVAALCSAFALSSQAHDYHAGSVHIDHPWSREMPPVAPTAAVYFTLHNRGEHDRLLGVSTPVASKAELHEHVHQDGVMKMQAASFVELAPGAEVIFAPMGYHVMLFGLKRQAREGERFPLTLVFEKAGEVTVEVAVQQALEAAGHSTHTGHSAPAHAH